MSTIIHAGGPPPNTPMGLGVIAMTPRMWLVSQLLPTIVDREQICSQADWEDAIPRCLNIAFDMAEQAMKMERERP